MQSSPPLRIAAVVGARPNFMKIDPIMRELKRDPESFQPVIVHTGQHYDRLLSDVFFSDLDMPEPDIQLGVGSASHAQQTAKIMVEFEAVCLQLQPDLVLVGGDVNSTMACALVAAKLRMPVAHVEAGLRSFDQSMPEEVNRKVTDCVSSYLFATCEDAVANLRREGIAQERIHLVGNTMIDTLRRSETEARKLDFCRELGLQKRNYGLVTLHRPSNVDSASTLREIVEALRELAGDLPVVFPVHPRTEKHLKEFGLWQTLEAPGIRILEPQSYVKFLSLMIDAAVVVTDSGGIQEETTVLGVPCITLRPNTERPITLRQGTNELVNPSNGHVIVKAVRTRLGRNGKPEIPRLWDGKASGRIVKVLRGIRMTDESRNN